MSTATTVGLRAVSTGTGANRVTAAGLRVAGIRRRNRISACGLRIALVALADPGITQDPAETSIQQEEPQALASQALGTPTVVQDPIDVFATHALAEAEVQQILPRALVSQEIIEWVLQPCPPLEAAPIIQNFEFIQSTLTTSLHVAGSDPDLLDVLVRYQLFLASDPTTTIRDSGWVEWDPAGYTFVGVSPFECYAIRYGFRDDCPAQRWTFVQTRLEGARPIIPEDFIVSMMELHTQKRSERVGRIEQAVVTPPTPTPDYPEYAEYPGEYPSEYPAEYSDYYEDDYATEYGGEYPGDYEYPTDYPGEYSEYPSEYPSDYPGEYDEYVPTDSEGQDFEINWESATYAPWPENQCSSPFAASSDPEAPNCPGDVGWINTPQNGSIVFPDGVVTLETGALWDDSIGQFIRVRYEGDDHEETRGVDIVHDFDGIVQAREIWGEIWMRFEDGWNIPTDDKTLFALPNTSARWMLNFSAGYFYGGAPGDGGNLLQTRDGSWMQAEAWNGQWGRLRFHFKMASDNMITEDGVYQVWWNNRVVADWMTKSEHDSNAYFQALALGRNTNVEGGGYRDWGRVRLWYTQPLWAA